MYKFEAAASYSALDHDIYRVIIIYYMSVNIKL